MALEIRYWESIGKGDEMLKQVRIKSVKELEYPSVRESYLVADRLAACSIITLERTDNQSPNYKVLWQADNYVELNDR